MSSTPTRTLTRLCIGGVAAAATIGSALVLPFGTANAAARVAGAPANVTISPTTAQTIAGNCQTYTVTVTDSAGTPVTGLNSSATNTVFVQVSEPTNTAGQTITPCTVSQSTTPTTATPNSAPATPNGGNGTTFSSTNPVTLAATPSTTANSGQYLVSFAASQPGTLNATPFVDRDNNQILSGNDLIGSAATETVDSTSGNRQQDTRNITAVLTPGQTTSNTTPGGAGTRYTITATDANGAPVPGVVVSYFVASGPGTSTTATPGSAGTTMQCSTAGTAPTPNTTDSNGQTICLVAGPATTTTPAGGTAGPTPSGTQTIRFFVDQNADMAFQTTEPTTTVTRQVVSNPAQATTVKVTPTGQTFPTGQMVTYSALVTDAQGNPVPGTTVFFSQTGAGGPVSSPSAMSDNNGVAKVTVAAASINDQGAQNVTATLTAPAGTASSPSQSTSCNPTTGTAPASCASTATNTISNVSASPSTSPSATPTASTSPSATPTASTPPSASPRPSASPSASPSPSGSVAPPVGTTCTNPAGMTLDRDFIVPGLPVNVTVTAPAGAEVELQAYSRPSTEYRQVRLATVGQSGSISFDVTPGTNTRLFADCVSQTNSASASKVINVRTALSLSVVRNGRRKYTFQGRILPRRAGQLITLYRVTNSGSRILTAQVKTDDSGTYYIPRTFTGSGTFGFLTRTGQNLTNASGESTSEALQSSPEYLNTGRGTARSTSIF